MGIFDDLGEVGDSLLKPIKKAAGAAGSIAPKAAYAAPFIGPTKALADVIGWDNVVKYAPAALIGGTFGAFAGAPAGGVGAVPGAFIGAGTAIASTYAGPKAAEALPEGTPDWVRTGAEFGVYGLGGGLGLGNVGSQMAARTAGKVGVEKIMAHLALKSSLEMGALSGLGAVGGEGLAHATGMPEELGTLGGSIAVPVAGPMAFNALRGNLYRMDTPGMKNIAEFFGANEANALKKNRVMDLTTTEVATNDHPAMLRALDINIAQQEANLIRYSPEMSEVYYRQATGGASRADLLAREQGRNIPVAREFLTPQYVRQQKMLVKRNESIAQAEQVYNDTVEKYSAEAAKVPQGGKVELRQTGTPREVIDLPPVPEGQVRLFGDPAQRGSFSEAGGGTHYVDVAAETAARYKGKGGYALPKAVSDRAREIPRRMDNPQSWMHVADDGTETLLTEDAVKAKMQIDNATKAREEAAGKLGKLLGVSDVSQIPPDIEAQRMLLRNKLIPDYDTKLSEVQKMLQDMDPREARRIRLAADEEANKFKAEKLVQIKDTQDSIAHLRDFREFSAAHPELGGVPPTRAAEAARAFAALRQQEALATQYGTHGYHVAREPAEPFRDYLKTANFVASKYGSATEEFKQTLAGYLTNPRGVLHVQTPAGGVEPVRLVSIDPRRETAMVRGLTEPESAARQVGFDDLVMRYMSPEQAAQRDSEIRSAIRERRRNNPGKVAESQMRSELQDIHRAVPAETEHITADQMQSDLTATRKAFVSLYMPSNPTITGRWMTPEHQQKSIKGFLELRTRGFKQNANKATIERDADALNWINMSFEQRRQAYLTADDVGILDHYNALPDDSPLKSVYLLLGSSQDDLMHMMDASGNVRMWGSAGQYFRKMAIGESVQSPVGRALLMDHFGAIEANATTAGAFWTPLLNMNDQIAAEMLGVPEGAGPQIARGFKAAKAELFRKPRLSFKDGQISGDRGFHPGRALKAGISEIHPLSHEGSMSKLLAANVDWAKAPKNWKRALAYTEEHHPESVDMVKQWLLSQQRTFTGQFGGTATDTRAMFGQLANDPRFKAAYEAQKLLDIDLAAGARLHGLAPDTDAKRMMMLVAPEYRSWLDRDVLRAGTGKERIKQIWEGTATPIDVANEVLDAMKAKGGTRSLADVLTWGREADMAGPVSLFQSMAMHETMRKVAKVAGRPVTPDDLVFKGGAWAINSRNKWPAEIARDLGGINDILSGQHKWQGLQKISQQIAMGNLAADLSLFGIQGYKYLAHSLLSGHLLSGPKNFAGFVNVPGHTGDPVSKTLNEVTTHINSDWGFYSWLRTNLDEIQYYTSLGLTGGLKGYIAGPEVRKLPLESLPIIGKSFIGKGFAGIRMGTDLQFNRQLFYWKVQGIRENLEVAKTLRALGRDFAERYVNSSPSLKSTVDDMGGLDGYLLGDHEDVVKATIRQVNRSLGGVNMNAEGIGVDRQAVEQIMMIVPGFFRAQVGQWASVITKPHTLEGQLAITMLAREYLFAATVASGLSHLMGTQDEVNYSDITKPTWLGVPLPNGDTVSLVPTMALPRLASRVIQNTVQNAGEGKVPDPSVALESFARGRMSPLMSSVYDNLTGSDFLGRKYDSVGEKWGMTLAQLTLPIIGSSMVEDLKEAQKHAGAGLGYNWMDIAENAGVNVLGKSTIPQSPRDKLDKAAQAAYGSDWSMLTDAEKADLRKDPHVTATEAEYDFYSSRRAGSEEQRVDSAYKGYADDIKRIWEEPRLINNFKSVQSQDDAMLLQGQMPGDVWRERYQARQSAAADRFDALDSELRRAGVDPDQIRADKMQRLREGRDPGSIAWLVQQAKTEYAGLKPDTVERRLSYPGGEITVNVVDWDKYHAQREAILSQYPAAVAERVRAEDSSRTPGIEAYKAAAAKQQAIEMIPRYRGLTTEQGDKIDQMQTVMAKMAESVKGQIGLPPGTAVPGLARAIRQKAIARMQSLDIINTPQDMQLAAMAIAMVENPRYADRLRNPAQVRAILDSPDATIFYPYLRYRIPRQMWGQLPAQVFNSPLVQAELQAGG